MSSHTITVGLESLQRAGGRLRQRPSPGEWFLIAVMAVLVALVVGHLVPSGARPGSTFPQSAAMEDKLGVRFSRVAVVGDGGLITLSYVVLDGAKATEFQSDVTHPPVLRSEARDASTARVSLMKQGHTLRPGQTFYLVYENTGAALRPGEMVAIDIGGLTLPHVPVL
jgi:hypothetical protein